MTNWKELLEANAKARCKGEDSRAQVVSDGKGILEHVCFKGGITDRERLVMCIDALKQSCMCANLGVMSICTACGAIEALRKELEPRK